MNSKRGTRARSATLPLAAGGSNRPPAAAATNSSGGDGRRDGPAPAALRVAISDLPRSSDAAWLGGWLGAGRREPGAGQGRARAASGAVIVRSSRRTTLNRRHRRLPTLAADPTRSPLPGCAARRRSPWEEERQMGPSRVRGRGLAGLPRRRRPPPHPAPPAGGTAEQGLRRHFAGAQTGRQHLHACISCPGRLWGTLPCPACAHARAASGGGRWARGTVREVFGHFCICPP